MIRERKRGKRVTRIWTPNEKRLRWRTLRRLLRKRRLRQLVGIAGACWEWTGYRRGSLGYGSARWRGRNVYVHRLVYALIHGSVASTKVVCHNCDNPLCFRPSHLQQASQSVNIRHQYQRNRRTRALEIAA